MPKFKAKPRWEKGEIMVVVKVDDPHFNTDGRIRQIAWDNSVEKFSYILDMDKKDFWGRGITAHYYEDEIQDPIPF